MPTAISRPGTPSYNGTDGQVAPPDVQSTYQTLIAQGMTPYQALQQMYQTSQQYAAGQAGSFTLNPQGQVEWVSNNSGSPVTATDMMLMMAGVASLGFASGGAFAGLGAGGSGGAATGAADAGIGATGAVNSVGPLASGLTAPAVTAAAPPAALAAGGGGAATGAGGLTSFLKSAGNSATSGNNLGLITGAGLGFLGNYLSGQANQQMSQQQLLAQLLQTQMGRQDTQNTDLASYLTSTQNLAQNQAQAGLNATQMDPYAQAKDLNNANVVRSYGQNTLGSPITGPSPSGIDLSALSPSNLQNTGNQFYMNAAAASPNVPIGNMSPSAESFRQSYLTNQNNIQQQILKYLQQVGAPVANPPGLPQV